MPPRAVPQSRLQRASGHSGVAGAGVPVRTPGALTYVRVAEGVLGVAGRARARLGAPVTQAPAAQEHDEPEPGSHCCCRCWGCCSPLQSCCARRWRSRCSRGSPTRRCGATLALGALPSECPAGRDGSRRGCLGTGARLQGPPLSLGQGAGAGAGAGKAAGGEAVREPASCPTLRRCRAADRYSAVSPSARPSDQSPSRITSSTPSEKGAGLWGGATRTVQILIGNNTAVGTRVGGLGRASDPRRGVALRAAPACPLSRTPSPHAHSALWATLTAASFSSSSSSIFGPHDLMPSADHTLQFQSSPSREATQGDSCKCSEGGRGAGRERLWGKLKTRPRKGPKITDTHSARNQTGSQIIRGVELLSPHF